MIDSKDVSDRIALVREIINRSTPLRGYTKSWYRLRIDGRTSGEWFEETVTAWLTLMHPSDRLLLAIAGGTPVASRGENIGPHNASLTALSYEWLFGLGFAAEPGSEAADIKTFQFALPGLTLGPIRTNANAFSTSSNWPGLRSVRFRTVDNKPHDLLLEEHERLNWSNVVAGDIELAVDTLREHAMGRSWRPDDPPSTAPASATS